MPGVCRVGLLSSDGVALRSLIFVIRSFFLWMLKAESSSFQNFQLETQREAGKPAASAAWERGPSLSRDGVALVS